jgi:hypothetical protein
MKMLDKKLLAIIEKEEYGLALTLLVNGITLTGILISEEQFFVESLRAYGSQVQNDKIVSIMEDSILKVTRTMQDEYPYIHLSGVTVFKDGLSGPISLPALRISPEHVSAWMFGLPGEDRITWRVVEDKIDDLGRDIRKGITP